MKDNREKIVADEPVKIAFISRVDYGGPGFCLGLLKLAMQICEREKVNFVVVAGGLISKAFKERLREYIAGSRGKERETLRAFFISQAIEYLRANFPRIKSADPNDEWVKMFIVTSPAYDGDLGNVIAHNLARKRKADIVHWSHGYGIFPTRKRGRDIAVLTPIKGAWMRGKYTSTPVERVILDWSNQHYGEEPGDLVIGCFGSHFQKPGGGESRWPFSSVPALSYLWDTQTGTENQVGLLIKEYLPNGPIICRNYNFNDLLTGKYRTIRPPRGASEMQKEIIEVMKREGGSQTIGLLAYHLGLGRNRRELRQQLEELRIDIRPNDGGGRFKVSTRWPGLVYDDAAKRYSFNPDWFQTRLRFNLPNCKKKKVDSIVAFGCLHAGCVHTNYDYFVSKLPDLIVRRQAGILVGAGDFIEGLKHDLILRGEVLGGMNNSEQEKLAAEWTGEVILRVFHQRMALSLGRRLGKGRVNRPTVRKAVHSALITFVYIYGNHCAWSKDSGYDPLGVFRPHLINHVVCGIEEFLAENKLVYLNSLRNLVCRRIIEINERDIFRLPSGLRMAIRHPWISRTLTTSIRLQQVLRASTAPVVISANFHVAAGMGHWENEVGERYCLQVGTIKEYSNFEGSKLKQLDSGVGCLKATSAGGRIWMTEVMFDNTGGCPSLDNSFVRQIICQRHNVKMRR